MGSIGTADRNGSDAQRGSNGSARPRILAVPGMNCATPCAPAWLTASGLKRLSCQMSRVKNSAGRSFAAAAAASTSQTLCGSGAGEALGSAWGFFRAASRLGILMHRKGSDHVTTQQILAPRGPDGHRRNGRHSSTSAGKRAPTTRFVLFLKSVTSRRLDTDAALTPRQRLPRHQSVQLAGMSDRLPSGKTTRAKRTPRRRVQVQSR
jgi:hypothetical protein